MQDKARACSPGAEWQLIAGDAFVEFVVSVRIKVSSPKDYRPWLTVLARPTVE
jgi:hypothetical protein